MAASIGLVTPHDIEEYKRKKQREKFLKSLKENSVQVSQSQNNSNTTSIANKPSTGASQSLALSRQGATGASRGSTGRLNEPLLTGRRTTHVGSRGSRLTGFSGKKYVVDQNEREVWVC